MSLSLQAWADAMAVEREFGDDAVNHVAEQIGKHIVGGDVSETARWHRIGRALTAIRDAKAQ